MTEPTRNSGAGISSQEMYILASLMDGPKHGYAIAKQVEDISENRLHLRAATLYGNIHRMLESGLIERDEEEFEIEPGVPRKRYRITGDGVLALEDHARLQYKVMQLIPGLANGI